MRTRGVEFHFQAKRPWQNLFSLYQEERFRLLWALIAYLFKASPIWILPVVTANIIDIVSQNIQNGHRAIWINSIIAAVAIAQNVLSAAVYVRLLSHSIRNVEVKLRSALVRRLQMLSINYHNQADTGILQTKITRDIESFEMMSRQLIDVGFIAAVTIIVTWVITAYRMPVFLPVFIILVPIILVIRRVFSKKLKTHNENLRRELEGMSSLIFGMLSMIPVTRAHALEAEEIDRAESKFNDVHRIAKSSDFASGIFGASVWVVLMLINLIGLTGAALLSYNGIVNLTPGDIVLLAGYFNTIMASVMQLNSMLPILTRGFDALESIGEVLESPDLEINQGKTTVGKIKGDFEFEKVNFHYQKDGNSEPILKDINFKVSAGEIIGIVGKSGSGKSTLASLLIGFHRPTTGRILLDGFDMNSLDLRSFRRQLAVVSQQTILFNGTVRENIIYGTNNITESQLNKAIESANAGEFINQLPEKLDTKIGSSGIQLSGGQRQRIAIARAILRDPKILILDEATSALDAESERIVEEAFEKLMVGRTTFIITHKLSILKNVKRIIKIENGIIFDDSNSII